MPNIRQQIAALARQTQVRQALLELASQAESVVGEAAQLQQIPAPTFQEAQRASHVKRRWEQCGLSDVSLDEVGVVYARLPGTDPEAPAVMVSAHLDTVFPAGTDLSLRRDGERLYGPGIGDNSIGVAALLALPHVLREEALHLPADVWFVATVAEEGLGNLEGMRQAVQRLRERLGVVVAVEGMALGHVFHRGLGVRRLKVSLRGPGGHSWLNYGQPSTIHSLLKLGAALSEVAVPGHPPSSLNIGLIEGGTSINTIAPYASLSLDLRSEDAATLDELEGRIRTVIKEFDPPAQITLQVAIIGDRPAGGLPRSHPLVLASGAVLNAVGVPRVAYKSASTDANVPLAKSLPAVCIGVTRGGNAHSLDEYIETAPVGTGLQQLALLTMAAAHFSRDWAVWDNAG